MPTWLPLPRQPCHVGPIGQEGCQIAIKRSSVQFSICKKMVVIMNSRRRMNVLTEEEVPFPAMVRVLAFGRELRGDVAVAGARDAAVHELGHGSIMACWIAK